MSTGLAYNEYRMINNRKNVTTMEQQIRNELENRLNSGISANKLAAQLGINAGTLSNVRQGKTELVSDTMWRKIAAGLQLQLSDGSGFEWQIFTTKGYETITALCADAHRQRRMLAVYGETGQGKTTALRQYAANHSGHTGYVLCDVLMTQSDFLNECLRAFGISAEGTRRQKVQRLTGHMRNNGSLLILDDLGKVSDSIYRIIQLIYDQTEGYAGIVVAGVTKMKNYLERGREQDKLGFRELYRRVGYWQAVPPLSARAIAGICEHYGIVQSAALAFINKVVSCMGTLKEVIANAKRAQELTGSPEITLDLLKGLQLSTINH